MENQTISGRYRFLQQLGEGGFSQTFLAEDLHLPTRPRCVVKHLKPQASDAKSIKIASRLFEQEAEILHRLGNHPNIPKLLAHFEEASEFYLVQELIEGHTLAQELAGGRILEEFETVKIIGQVLETLSFVHSQNVIHRDIKPANLIRRQSDGRIFLIDFGAVKQVSAGVANESSNCQSTVTIGSQGYMPGEQMAGKPRYASDLYALGLVAIEALTGIHPLKLNQNPNSGEFVWQHKTHLHTDVENFISKLVKYDFRQRYISAKEAAAALNMIATNLGIFRKNRVAAPVAPLQPPPPIHPISPLSFVTQIPQIPPTIIVPPLKQFQPPERAEIKKGFFNWLWEHDAALGAFVALLVFGFFFIGGYVLISRAISNSDESKMPPNRSSESTPINPNLQFDKSLSAFEEAQAQAREAEAKQKKATTKHEWQEIGNQYKRAYTLLASIEPSSTDYTAAQEMIITYKQNSEYAFQQISTAGETSTIAETTTAATTNPSEASAPTSYQYPNAAPTPAPKVTMPPKQSYRTYLSYNYVNYNRAENKVITTGDANFTSSVERQSENKRDSGVVRIRIDGGSYSSANLEMIAPYGQRLAAGSYPNAQEYLWQSPTMYAVSFDKLHCFENGHHNFTVNSIVYDAVGASVLYLDATFSINCGTGKLMGRIRYDAR